MSQIQAGNTLRATADYLFQIGVRRNPSDWEGDPRFTGDFIGWDDNDSHLFVDEQPSSQVNDLVLVGCEDKEGRYVGSAFFHRMIVEGMRAAYLDEVTVLRRLAFNVINKTGEYSSFEKDDESKLEFLKHVVTSSERGRNMWMYTGKVDRKWVMFIANTGILVEAAVRGDIAIANDALLENYTAQSGEMTAIYNRSRAYIAKLKSEFAVDEDMPRENGLLENGYTPDLDARERAKAKRREEPKNDLT